MTTNPVRLPGKRPARILLVEDEIFIRMDLAAALREAGFEVIEADRADAAIEFVESGEPVDLVFTDIQMPGAFDGLALAGLFRARYPMVPVLIGSANPALESAASKLGKFISKPYDPGGIARLIAACTQ
ncbi:response regulator [Bradyrhizobium liaoningense]|uniref:response regulator n=1 Tax=Bradyrhizobium liaoningense TaxID=43992 RepID=UPI001BADB05E|nr:response regulator [Bradyrhizobium liaoningense]MBR0707960.1 response regulator [Bradyrhizobium liaoningense]